MKFPRNARMFKGQLDAAPFACVLFCLLIFLLLALVVPIPGIPVHLPEPSSSRAKAVTGSEGRTVTVALDAGGPQNPNGILYFQNEIVDEKELERRLKQEVMKSPEPLTLVLLSDKKVPTELLYRLAGVAAAAGIKDMLLGVQAGIFDSGAGAREP